MCDTIHLMKNDFFFFLLHFNFTENIRLDTYPYDELLHSHSFQKKKKIYES